LAILLAAGLWESFSRAPATGASASADSAKWRSPTQGIAASDARKLRLDGQISPIIVLPFDAPDAPSLAGMAGLVTGDLINALSRISALRVMSRGTSFAYKGKATDPAVIAAETGVRYVLEGTIRELDERRVRVQVELIESATRLAVWSDRIEGSRDERGKAVDDIVLSLARGLHMETVQLEASHRGPDTGGVGDLISKGWASTFGAARSPQKLKAAQDYFNEALEKSPGHPAAQTGLAAVYVTSVAEMHTGERAALLAKADKLLREVLAQRPDFYSAIYYQGLLFKLRNNMDKALQNFARAIQINPSDAGAYAQIGNILMQTGKPAEALEHVRYAMRLGPKDPVLPIWLRMAGEIELELDHLAQAKEYITRSLELSPGAPRSWATLAAIGALTDDRQEAKRAAAELRKLLAAPSDPAVLQRFARGSPDDPNARKLIRGLRQALAF
jgi:TolB-like protein/tetratricopeptide (TPR) repeat protein